MKKLSNQQNVLLYCIQCEHRRKFPNETTIHYKSTICNKYKKKIIIAGHDGYGGIFKGKSNNYTFYLFIPKEDRTADLSSCISKIPNVNLTVF